MINRTTIKNSRFDILNESPETISAYIEEEQKKTPEQRQQEAKERQQQTNIENVNLQDNIDNQDPQPSNNIVIYTRKDNLTHNYFHYLDFYWDAGDCMSTATLRMPKTEVGNTQYWITYTGEVEIYTGNNIDHSVQSTTSENNSNTNEVYWNLQGLKPIFRGEIGRIKEYNEVLEIHIDSIGKRFKQKIPDDFRQSYINGQNVRDAFQAICEFLGVKYICPPADPKPTDDEEEEESATTDGTENNADDKMNTEQKLNKAASNKASKSNKSKNNKSKNNNQDSKNQNQNSENNNSSDTEDSESDTDTEEDTVDVDAPQNGYTDVSFDANGSIVHGSVVIETSPDMAETLIALTEHPLDKYLEDTTFVATDVKKFLEGEMFETVHGNFLDYGSVTIEPASANSSDMSTVSSESTPSSDENSDSSGSNSGGGGSASSSGGTAGVKGTWGKTAAGSYYLTKEAINRMSPDEAHRRYLDGKQRNIYTAATMQKLFMRSCWLKV